MSALFSKQFTERSKIRAIGNRLKRAARGRGVVLRDWRRKTSFRSAGKQTKRLTRRIAKKALSLKRRITGGLIYGPRSLADNIQYFANPGPQFEHGDQIDGQHLTSRARTIAFYLPQFHSFAENDKWWGKGFNEWRNVARGTPRFRGHYQPRIPRDLGFYDLSNLDTIRSQSDLAKHNGIDAFCFYYYWFNGKRLMEKPLDLLVESDIDQDFCIMWANENWTRTWDGLENDVLIKQDYLDQDEDAFIADTGRYMADSRYVRMAGQPLFILYRPGLLPDAKTTIDRWRAKWTALLGETPFVMMVQGFDEEDPRVFGLDGAVEFPPHKVCAGLKNINDRCQILDSSFKGLVRDYADVVDKSLDESTPEFPLIKTVSPHWDNDARRERKGMVMHGSTPALYEKWLNGAIDFAVENPVNQESVVFVNAWNEWAEGAYLEPDVHYGHAYLNATKRAVKGLSDSGDTNRVLLVGHDAHRHGAQMLLLNMARIYKQQFGMEVVIALKEGGPLLSEYRQLTNTVVLDKLGKKGVKKWLARQQFSTAISNTTVTGDLVPLLRGAGIRVVSLIHEMPNLIRDYKLENRARAIATQSNHVVFPAQTVQDGFAQFTDRFSANVIVQPQGTYSSVTFDAATREAIRDTLGIASTDKLVLGVGYADLRKGFDLFMDTARRAVRCSTNVHFVWAGALSSDMQRWIQTDFSDQIHIIGFTNNVTDYYSAADALYLPSREDPYPTVVLEAMDIGLPVLLYRGATGFDSLMESYGYVVDFSDTDALDEALYNALNEADVALRNKRIAHVETHCRLDNYCFELLTLLHPTLQRISVAVPNYNYGQYIEQRLSSIFAQNYPVFEVLMLDDNSNDNSVAIAEQTAHRSGRDLTVVSNSTNSGNVFNQWQHAGRISRGDLLWIAEADDSAETTFLAKLVESAGSDTAMIFCDSAQIGASGEHLSKSYQHYFSKIHPRLFTQNFKLSGTDFCSSALAVRNVIMNVSGVLWNRARLNACMAELDDELPGYSLVGDWRIYLELLSSHDTSIAFVAESLNKHRRHRNSVTQVIDAKQHLDEIQAIHRFVLANQSVDSDTQRLMDEYVAELSAQFNSEASVRDKAA